MIVWPYYVREVPEYTFNSFNFSIYFVQCIARPTSLIILGEVNCIIHLAINEKFILYNFFLMTLNIHFFFHVMQILKEYSKYCIRQNSNIQNKGYVCTKLMLVGKLWDTSELRHNIIFQFGFHCNFIIIYNIKVIDKIKLFNKDKVTDKNFIMYNLIFSDTKTKNNRLI